MRENPYIRTGGCEMRYGVQGPVLVLILLVSTACGTINRPIHIADGSQVSRMLSSVNGSIDIGKACEINGSCHTINGSIKIDDGTRVDGKVASINGSIRIGSNVIIDGSSKAVNGSVTCGPGARIGGNVSTVNGCITLTGTTVDRNLVTYNGRISLMKGTQIVGNVIIREAEGNFRRSPLKITLGGKSVIHGDIINENPELTVKVEVLEGSAVKGEIVKCEVNKD